MAGLGVTWETHLCVSVGMFSESLTHGGKTHPEHGIKSRKEHWRFCSLLPALSEGKKSSSVKYVVIATRGVIKTPSKDTHCLVSTIQQARMGSIMGFTHGVYVMVKGTYSGG